MSKKIFDFGGMWRKSQEASERDAVRWLRGDGRADDEAEDDHTVCYKGIKSIPVAMQTDEQLKAKVDELREQMERELREQHKDRAVPESDTPPVTELPGQGRCVGYVVAQRTWPVSFERGVVTSGFDTEWPPGEPVKATDPGPTMMGHGAGLYAMKLGEEIALPATDWHSMYAAGLVALWGRIKEHERGFRAEWAYPLEFQHLSLEGPFADAMLAVLNERYGCRKHSERVNVVEEDHSGLLWITGQQAVSNFHWSQPQIPSAWSPQSQQGMSQLLNSNPLIKGGP